ncbi:MAG: RNase adapter RapZ [Ruminococcaceae bacterium]|nr:RNase adapter RapZ [Oscillospiraceae bacterium]
MEFLIITGMSGAGKSQAANTLEDLGWYCIDNMPAQLIPKFAELYSASPGKLGKVAFIVDIRGEVEFETLFAELDGLKKQGFNCRTIFMECADEVIISRYKFTRRTHPLVAAKNISIAEALTEERAMLAPAKSRADYTIDTTKLAASQLKEKIFGIVNTGGVGGLLVTCMSFGFKHGAASEADLVFDVRCFPNPYYHEELKEHTGLEAPVRDFVFSHAETTDFLAKLHDMIDYLLPLYQREGKTQLIIAIGCTGGKHRSVAIAEALASHIRAGGYRTVTIHRDITK